jgi:cell division protein FtsN
MPRDYKGLANAKSKKKRNSPRWVWFVSGVLVGLFSAGLVWLKFASPGPEAGVAPASAGPASAQRGKQGVGAENGKPPPPRFDFYTMLPEMEIVIPEEELREPASPGSTASTLPPRQPETTEQEAYLLQMGSFRNHTDADRMKARLALLDIPAEIQKVTINNKDTFHRVRSGPYRSRSRLNELRTRLQRNNIKSMVIRLKK